MTTVKYLKRPGELHGSSVAMEHLYRQLDKVAGTNATVLLSGESGTGKELIAHAIHQTSRRAEQNFVAVNCGAIAPHLMEAALFGHEKGSFTGALRQQPGYFESAFGGTLFLDEITEIPTEMQAKLLRVLETGTFLRVGGDHDVKVDVRLIAATNRDVVASVRNGCFRADLMYRLAVFPVHVPPLRERGGDGELLAEHFLQKLNDRHGTRKRLSPRAQETIRLYAWPGNVRELKNAIQRAFILCGDMLDIEGVDTNAAARKPQLQDGCLNFSVGTPLADAQRVFILATLKHFGGNKRLTAEALGISLKTLYNRLKDY